MKCKRWLGLAFASTFLFFCGCGSKSSNAGSVNPPTGLTYSSGAAIYTNGVAITPNIPTSSGGAITSYSVSPALPAGLTLSSGTGAISGTPTKVSAAANYTVTASNAAGSVTATVSITVNPAAPATLAYAINPASYQVGVAIAANAPTSAGGSVASYSVVPTLPWGLSLNSSTGVISGTPTVATPPTNYTVTAYNAGGNASAIVSITVANGAPANLTYSNNPATYTANRPILANIPSNSGGDATGYTVTPALPAGLTLNPVTGVVAGVPTAPASSSNYTVSASNAFGSTSATLTITVNNLSAALVYSPSSVVFTAGAAITPLSPNGGAGSSYTVSPTLPDGLTLDSSSGTISGTPAQVTPTETYTVTASGPTGNTVGSLSITVDDVAPWSQSIPNMDQTITPLAPANAQVQQLNPDLADDPAWLATHAATTAISPDGGTMLVMTSGYNRVFNDSSNSLTSFYGPDSNEYVFVYDISSGAPIKKQVLPVPVTYFGIAWDPTSNGSSAHFYVSTCSADYVFVYSYNPATQLWFLDTNNTPNLGKPGQTPASPGAPFWLGHTLGIGLDAVPPVNAVPVNAQVAVYPCAAGIALSNTGKTMVVANYYNDSISVLTGGYGNWAFQNVATGGTSNIAASANLDLRPGKSLKSAASGMPGGEYPFWVQVAGSEPNAVAYVSSIRDREIDVVPLNGSPLGVTARIAVKGQPNKMVMNKAQTLLYVAEDQSDTIDVIDINPDPTHLETVNTVIETIPVIAPAGLFPTSFYSSNSGSANTNPIYAGSNTNSLTLSNDETKLYVTNGTFNNVAVVQLTGTNSGDKVVGLIPTGWYPNSVSVGRTGWMYVANAKSPTGPNPDWCYGYGPTIFQPNCFPANEYNPQRTKAGLQSFPIPRADQLPQLTAQVATNNRFSSTESKNDAQVMAAVSSGVKHVIYILKENRTYDQVLGDLVDANGMPIGDQDRNLVQWGQAITPNQHSLARTFVTLDHFYATSEVSYDGWLWSTSAQSPDVVEHQFPVVYGFRALSLDSEGLNRSVNAALPTLADRIAANPLTPNDPDVLPGQTAVSAPDGPNNEINTGYLWNAVLRAGLTVRNYGFFIDTTCYNQPGCFIPEVHYPASSNTVVATPANAALAPYTDPYFRGFDNNFPDYYRYKEWEREFDANYASGGLPALSLVRFMHDHTGSFGTAIDLVNTPELQQADNDYAVGLLVQKIANSIYAQNTLIFVIEDDAQDGADHVDSHRTIAFVAGAYVKQNAVVSTHYNTVDFIRTMEEVLGLKQYLNLNDALGHPMTDIFTTTPQPWQFTATPSAYLYATQLPLPNAPVGMKVPHSTHNSVYWARVTRGLDFSDADRLDPLLYNRILWKGVMRNRPIPASLKGKRAPDDDD
ncbi:MAG: putative Ig domain-containing protein [Acidobacteriota bacterium]